MAGTPPTSPQGPDGARTPALSHLIWYTSVCLISSVHLSGRSGINLAVQHAPQILSQASQLPFKGLTEEVNSARCCLVSSFPSSDFCKVVAAIICVVLLLGSVIKVMQMKSHVSRSSCHSLSPEVGGPASVGRMMHVHWLPSLPAEQSGITKQSGWPLSHMLTTSLCPLSLCIMVLLSLCLRSPSCLLTLSLHTLFTCFLSTSASLQSHLWPPSPPPMVRLDTQVFD